jgi:hypothetical protein
LPEDAAADGPGTTLTVVCELRTVWAADRDGLTNDWVFG